MIERSREEVMKKIEVVNKAIEKILTKPVVNWYCVREIDNEVYEIKFYINFYIDDENEMKMFEEDVKELVNLNDYFKYYDTNELIE